jgi:hypothetical protein
MTRDFPTTWPFVIPRNTVAVTTRSVMQENAPIVIVQNLADGEGWTFLDGQAFDVASALLVTIGSIYDRDPSIGVLADMPEGWVATREAHGASWRREHDDV